MEMPKFFTQNRIVTKKILLLEGYFEKTHKVRER